MPDPTTIDTALHAMEFIGLLGTWLYMRGRTEKDLVTSDELDKRLLQIDQRFGQYARKDIVDEQFRRTNEILAEVRTDGKTTLQSLTDIKIQLGRHRIYESRTHERHDGETPPLRPRHD